MIHQRVTRVSLESFRERSAGKKVVLLYPWTNYRNLFLSYFLSSAENGLLYYRIPHEATTLQDWVGDMVSEFDQVLGGFGADVRAALDRGQPDAIANALAASLGAHNKKRVILYVDELDRAPFDATFDRFINALVAGLPDHVQLAFSSRLLTHQPWYDMVVEGTAVVLGTEYRKDDVMFTIEDEIKPQLEVYGFGRGHALVNGREITNWDGALPRNLFFYFVDNALVTRDDIFSTFWPNLSIKEATNVFHVTKRKISERITMKIDGGENYELTQYSSGFYMPGLKVVRHYDVLNFQEAVEEAMTTEDIREQERLYRRAVDLYKAPFLETVKMSWVKARRDHLRLLFAQALIGLGRIFRDRGQTEESFGFFSRALKETPEREDIHREVMKLYLAMKMPEEARKQYYHLEKLLSEEMNIAPASETRELFESI